MNLFYVDPGLNRGEGLDWLVAAPSGFTPEFTIGSTPIGPIQIGPTPSSGGVRLAYGSKACAQVEGQPYESPAELNEYLVTGEDILAGIDACSKIVGSLGLVPLEGKFLLSIIPYATYGDGTIIATDSLGLKIPPIQVVVLNKYPSLMPIVAKVGLDWLTKIMNDFGGLFYNFGSLLFSWLSFLSLLGCNIAPGVTNVDVSALIILVAITWRHKRCE